MTGYWLLLWPLLCAAASAEVVVIVPEGAELGQLSRVEVRDIYLGLRRDTAGGVTVRPYGSGDEKVQHQFAGRVLVMSPVAYKAHWARMVFAGNGRPPRILAGDEVAVLAGQQPLPLLYVDLQAIPVGWRVVYGTTVGGE
ncbi:MAG: hypothetical protein II007_10995 [Gammaproteobacteria bacterium]|nr:hypothetical protein [Gammaproteobacteria bacterium]